jgi:hypothetical protein
MGDHILNGTVHLLRTIRSVRRHGPVPGASVAAVSVPASRSPTSVVRTTPLTLRHHKRVCHTHAQQRPLTAPAL